ncbi:MAG TPA: alpha-amylase family glycosyl hydrolase [Methylomirabilota bacterium]
MAAPRYPSLYQINTRIWLHELGLAAGRAATLDDIPDAALKRIAGDGFDWVWLLGIWQTGEAGRRISRRRAESFVEYGRTLPDVTVDDVCGSPFAVSDYAVNRDFGGRPALDRFRERLGLHGLRLMLDFVPNHTALDHAWAREHPEFYVHGIDDDLRREPGSYYRAETRDGRRVLAHGRDPHFPAWADTLQVNHRHAGLRRAMLAVLESISAQCDGVRCDMAMLLLPEIIARTWGDRALPADDTPPVDDSFWPVAIDRVRRRHPDFVFLAEVYWDLESTLQQQGFDYTYDKRLYDRLRSEDAAAVRDHLLADLDYQRRSVRFLENHDEPRAAAVFPEPVHRAAAVLTFFAPGVRFVHDGQASGRRLHASIHLRRRAAEPVDLGVEAFYRRLFACMRRREVREGDWRLLPCRPAWYGNPTWQRFIVFSWENADRRLLAAVNYGPTSGQCYVALPWADLDARTVVLQDLLNERLRYERDGADLARRGLYLDLPAWGHHAFELTHRPC